MIEEREKEIRKYTFQLTEVKNEYNNGMNYNKQLQNQLNSEKKENSKLNELNELIQNNKNPNNNKENKEKEKEINNFGNRPSFYVCLKGLCLTLRPVREMQNYFFECFLVCFDFF